MSLLPSRARLLTKAGPEAAPFVARIDKALVRGGKVSGQACDCGDFGLLVDSHLDFGATRDKLLAWWKALPDALRLRPVDIIVIPRSAILGNEKDDMIGGDTCLKSRCITLVDPGDDERLRYFFLHEMSHSLLDCTSFLRKLISAALTVEWKRIAMADRRSIPELADDGLCDLVFNLGGEDGCDILLPLDSDSITRYAEGSRKAIRWLEDMADSLAIYLLAQASGGDLRIDTAVTHEGSLARVGFRRGEKKDCGLALSLLYPHRCSALDALCAWRKDENYKRDHWLAAIKVISEQSRALA